MRNDVEKRERDVVTCLLLFFLFSPSHFTRKEASVIGSRSVTRQPTKCRAWVKSAGDSIQAPCVNGTLPGLSR